MLFPRPKKWFHIWIWAGTFQAKNPWKQFLEEWLDLHFKGAALHKTDWVTVLINYTNYSFTICFNILQIFTVSYSIYNIIAH